MKTSTVQGKKEVQIITGADWHVTRSTPYETLHYPYRPSKGEIEGVPGIRSPKILLRKNYNTADYEYINLRELGIEISYLPKKKP